MKEILPRIFHILLILLFLFLAQKFLILGLKARGSLSALYWFAMLLFSLGILTILIAPPLSDWVASKFIHSLYFPDIGKVEERLYSLPRSLVKKGEYEEAVKEYEKLLEEDEEDRTARFELAEVLLENLNRPREALKHLEILYQTSEDEKEKDFLLARIVDCLLKGGEKEKALTLLKQERKEGKDWIEERIKALEG